MNKILGEGYCVIKRDGTVLKTTDFRDIPALYKNKKAGWGRAISEYRTKSKALEAGVDVIRVLLIAKSDTDENT